MMVTFSMRSIVKRAKLYLMILILALIILYILPKMLTFFWNINTPGQKLREDHLMEKPLRVISTSINISS